jgi:hypothetical protein
VADPQEATLLSDLHRAEVALESCRRALDHYRQERARKAKAEEERRARDEAERTAREEAARKAKEEAERDRLDRERQAREAAELLESFTRLRDYCALMPDAYHPWWSDLGIWKTCTRCEAQSAYRQLAQGHHPDRGGDGVVMVAINAAWERAQRYFDFKERDGQPPY